MVHPTVKLGLPLLLALAAGCTTMGTGFGSTASGKNPVNFSWKSSDSVSGSMNATLSDGKTFTGQFFQITSDTTVDKVLANLVAADGQHMRCNFQLVHPSDGMASGGRGQCQLPQGNTIDTTFPKA